MTPPLASRTDAIVDEWGSRLFNVSAPTAPRTQAGGHDGGLTLTRARADDYALQKRERSSCGRSSVTWCDVPRK